jgi:hypothetical protein
MAGKVSQFRGWSGLAPVIWLGALTLVAPHARGQKELDLVPPEDERQAPVDGADEGDVNLGAADADPARVAALITQLGAPEHEKREAASTALAELCPGAFRQLARAYREIDDYETRLRIHEIVRTQYLWHILLKHKGFLGVSYQQNSATQLEDGSFVVPIGVRPGTAAHDAGLRDRDLIRAIDDHRFADASDTAVFRDLIQEKGAGGKVRLEILRGAEILTFEVTLRARPVEDYEGNELLDELNSRVQAYTLWWSQHFSLPAPRAERTPSTAVLEIPE